MEDTPDNIVYHFSEENKGVDYGSTIFQENGIC